MEVRVILILVCTNRYDMIKLVELNIFNLNNLFLIIELFLNDEYFNFFTPVNISIWFAITCVGGKIISDVEKICSLKF